MRRVVVAASVMALSALLAPTAQAAGFEVNGYWQVEADCVEWKQSVIDENWAEVQPYGRYCFHNENGYYYLAKY